MPPRTALRWRSIEILSTKRSPVLLYRFYTTNPPAPTPQPRVRHAVITGGSRGIGLAIAQLLASHSYRITLISRSLRSLEAAALTLPHPDPSNPIKHRIVAADVTDAKFWESVAGNRETENEGIPALGRVDVLVNSAGIAQSTLLVRTPTDELQSIMDTNLTAPMLAIRALVKGKNLRGRASREGEGEGEGTEQFSPVVINLSSLLAVQGGRGTAAYSASKAGVLGLTRALAAELGPMGIRVNAIVPGYVETDMTKDFPPHFKSSLTDKIPLKRFGTADEIAQAALFLTTNQYANNCVINLDGGLSAV